MAGRPRKPSRVGRAWLFLPWFLLSAGAALPAEGRFTLSPYVDCSYSSNIFWDRSGVNDTIITPGLGLGVNAQEWTLYLNAEGRVYRSNDFLNSTTVSGGADYVKIISARTSLLVSPEIALNRYRDEISFLDALSPGITLGLKHSLNGQMSGRLGLQLRYSDYQNEDAYDRFRLGAFLETSAFFRTQTTLRLTLGINYQLFPHLYVPQASAAADTAAPASRSSSGPGSGKGNRPDDPGHPAEPDPPLPPGDASPAEPEVPAAAQSVVTGLTMPQPFAILRIAQGIGYQTGIVAEIMVRESLAPLRGIQSIAAAEWALEQTEDDFFWDGWRLSLGVKTEALLGAEVALDLSWFEKRYAGIAALDLGGAPLPSPSDRFDTMIQANARIARRLGRFAPYISGSYRRNRSNDLNFQYDFLIISAGLEVAL